MTLGPRFPDAERLGLAAARAVVRPGGMVLSDLEDLMLLVGQVLDDCFPDEWPPTEAPRFVEDLYDVVRGLVSGFGKVTKAIADEWARVDPKADAQALALEFILDAAAE